jgi:single-stranded-DNA-specific exonuclease
VGLARLSAGPNQVGLRVLLESIRLAGRPIESHHVAFMLAPRLNAAGRMSDPDLAARLLLLTGDDPAGEARQLAERLNAENERRQQEERAILDEARKQVERDPDVGAHNVLVVGGAAWHRGVIGIVASKLVETFHKPAVVLSMADGVAHGSGRSVPAFDLLGALETCADLFDRFGGHRQAAGFSLDAARVPALRERLHAHADTVLTPDDLRPRLHLDASLPLAEVTPDLVESLVDLAPFGLGNPRPVFDAAAVEIVDRPAVLKERHLAMTVRQHGRMFRALAWRGTERLAWLQDAHGPVDLAYSVARNEWRGTTTIELEVADARPRAG